MTDWNQCYVEGNTPWNKGQPSPPLAQYLARHPLVGRVFAPGCGAGHDVALIASQGADVIGLDISLLAIDLAKKSHPELPASTWMLGDLFALPAEFTGAFDAVVEHTCFCAIDPALRVPYRDTVHRLLKPGGLLIGVWFIDPEHDEGYAGPPYALPVPELDALFSEQFDIVEDYVPDVAFDGRLHRERVRVLRKKA